MSIHTDPSTYTGIPANHTNALLMPLFALLSNLVILLPLRAFWQLKNFPACSLCIVSIYLNSKTVVNAFTWPNDQNLSTSFSGAGLCDVESYLLWPMTLALTTCNCCLTKGLGDALDTDDAVFNPSRAQRRRRLYGEVLFCWGPPVIMCCLLWTLMAGRYSIVPVFGCATEFDNSWPLVAFVIAWAPIFTLLTVYYAARLLLRLKKHRRTISATLASTGSNIIPRRFIKLSMIAISLLAIYFPIQTYFIYNSFPTSFVPYSWARLRANFSAPSRYHTGDMPGYQYLGWVDVSEGFLLALFYGFNDEAIGVYRRWMVLLGLGSVWPGLRDRWPRPRGGSSYSGGSGEVRERRFDLVGKAMKYFDTESESEGARSTLGSHCEEELVMVRGTEDRSVSGNITCPHPRNQTTTTPEKSIFSLTSASELPSPTPSSSHRRLTHNPFATIRTRYLNPFIIFSKSSNTAAGMSTTSSRPNLPLPQNQLNTEVWASSQSRNHNSTTAHHDENGGNSHEEEDGIPMGPTAPPPLGSRERREWAMREDIKNVVVKTTEVRVREEQSK